MVTGATGFVGRHLVRRLFDDGWSVAALVRNADADLPGAVDQHTVSGDVEQLTSVVANIRPTVCFHLATAFRGVHVAADIDPMVETNIGFGTKLAEAVSRSGDCRFVNTGTVWQHYHAQTYSPVSLYAATKQAFTDVLRFYQEVDHLDVVTLELTDTYGPGDTRPKLLPHLVRAVREGLPVELTDGTQLIDLLHVSDAVSALLATANGESGATYGASSDAAITLKELVQRVEAVSGESVDARWGARQARPREMMRPWMVSDPPPNWSPTMSLEDGIAELFQEKD